jgi:hypothetical protein
MPIDLGAQAKALLEQQKTEWEMLRGGYENLQSVETRTLEFDGFVFRLQFNPRRITSSAAKVDAKSIAERKCFLCPGHLPPEQRGVPFGEDYLVLCNPFPIFPHHFTIPHRQHVPQRIASSFEAMLMLAQGMKERYTVFYNGPKCGASAPDHLHFQAGDGGFMPVDREYETIKRTHGAELVEKPSLRAYGIGRYLRKIVSFESPDRAALVRAFDALYAILREMQPGEEEPMMNVLASHTNGAWRVVVFPRIKHRPSFFFEEGEKKILLSPASVDFGGVCITPIQKDFERLTKDHLIQMFNEVSMGAEAFETLCGRLRRELAGH